MDEDNAAALAAMVAGLASAVTDGTRTVPLNALAEQLREALLAQPDQEQSLTCLVNAGVIPPLIACLGATWGEVGGGGDDEDADDVEADAAARRNLTVEAAWFVTQVAGLPDHGRALADQGVLSTLTRILADGHPQARSQVIAILPWKRPAAMHGGGSALIP